MSCWYCDRRAMLYEWGIFAIMACSDACAHGWRIMQLRWAEEVLNEV